MIFKYRTPEQDKAQAATINHWMTSLIKNFNRRSIERGNLTHDVYPLIHIDYFRPIWTEYLCNVRLI